MRQRLLCSAVIRLPRMTAADFRAVFIKAHATMLAESMLTIDNLKARRMREALNG